MKHLLNQFAAIVLGLYGVLLRCTCRVRLHHDQRAEARDRGYRCVFGTGHAYQIAGMVAAERGTGALVSRSRDGGLVVPMLKWCGHVPVRGSSGTGSKGGGPALQALIKHVRGGQSAMLAFDGPSGPAGQVRKGLAMLAAKSDSAAFFALGKAQYRLILKNTWDRLQIPLPFSRIDLYLSEPLYLGSDESLEHFTQRLQKSWDQLQEKCDPQEAIGRSNLEQSVQKTAA